MPLNKVPQKIALPSAENAEYSSDIQQKLDTVFAGCRELNKPLLFEGNREYVREFKWPEWLYRVTRRRDGYCAFEFPHNNRLSLIKTWKDWKWFEAWLPAEKSTDSLLFQSNGNLLAQKGKIDSAVQAVQSAYDTLRAFVETETSGQISETTAAVGRIMQPRQ